ncbi:thioesterase family protein [Amycolatopsis pigmentata]|uniref:Thioesterase family protein n=1 Tax=Amycolatopsis pigmentata TaxID=450801 RepID=A0ABW5FYU2_9PSEU
MVIPVRTVIYTVTEKDSVRAIELSPEFCRHKPAVMASARLVAVCEWPCMEQLREGLGPHQCSLGVFQHLRHTGPIPIGARIALAARCVSRSGPYSEWEVEVHDGFELVGSAHLGFVVVDQAEFERRRLHGKHPAEARSPVAGQDHEDVRSIVGLGI